MDTPRTDALLAEFKQSNEVSFENLILYTERHVALTKTLEREVAELTRAIVKWEERRQAQAAALDLALRYRERLEDAEDQIAALTYERDEIRLVHAKAGIERVAMQNEVATLIRERDEPRSRNAELTGLLQTQPRKHPDLQFAPQPDITADELTRLGCIRSRFWLMSEIPVDLRRHFKEVA